MLTFWLAMLAFLVGVWAGEKLDLYYRIQYGGRWLRDWLGFRR